MHHRPDVVLEALELYAGPDSAGLKALDVVLAFKDAVLKVQIVSIIPARIADHHDVVTNKIFGTSNGQRQRRTSSLSRYAQNRHVPVWVNHQNVDDSEIRRPIILGSVDLALEIDGRSPGLILDAHSQSGREELGHMAVCHQQSIADNKSGARVRKNWRER